MEHQAGLSKETAATRGSPWAMVGVGLSFVLITVALYMAFIYAPTEAVMGNVQRIFYFHVPLYWLAFLAFGVVFVSSIMYIWKRNVKWDLLAYSAGEVGVVFTSLGLISGMIWARPAWGKWWVMEDPRLTTTAVLWLIYVAYLMIRAYSPEGSRGSLFAAVVGIVGFMDVPLVAISVYWQIQHPAPLVFESSGLDPSMRATLMVSLLAFTVFFVVLLTQRIALRRAEHQVQRMRHELS